MQNNYNSITNPRESNLDTGKFVETVMKGDLQTESEQTRSDEAAYKAFPEKAEFIHERSSRERTKRTYARCVFGFACVAAGALVAIKSIPKIASDLLKK